MKFSLRSLAFGAAILAVGAMAAQETSGVQVTQKWITKDLIATAGSPSAGTRTGSGVNGVAYVCNGTSILTYDGTEVKTLYTAPEGTALNRGFAVDEAGNIAIAASWPTSTANWANWLLIKADGSEALPITLEASESSDWTGNRTDLVGRAVGDFFSEDGGLFYLTTNQMVRPLPILIKNGEQEVVEFLTDADFGACNNMAYANPRYSMAETEDYANEFFIETSNMAQIGYVDEDEAAAFIAWPETGDLLKGQNGFDVFYLDDDAYAVHVFNATNWGSNFMIWNINTGEVVYQSDYSAEYNGKTTGNGCSFVARQITDTKVELYQCYVAGGADAGNSFNALYEITLGGEQPEEKHIYIAGMFQNWNPSEPAEFTKTEDGKYEFNYVQTGGQTGFKISTVSGAGAEDAWAAFNSGLLGVAGNEIATGNTYELVAGLEGDYRMVDGDYTLTIDLAAMTLTVTGEATPPVEVEAPVLYLRGGFNGWGYSEETTLAAGEIAEDGTVVYTISVPSLEGEFKIANDPWSINFGKEGGALELGNNEVAKDKDNMVLPAGLTDITLTLTINVNNPYTGTLNVAGTEPAPEMHAFAYALKGEEGENDTYKVTFKLNAPADKATVKVADAEGNVVATAEVASPAKGENTVDVSLAEVEVGTYTWSVEVVSSNELTTGKFAWKSEDYMTDAAGRGGVVFMRDTDNDAFGHVVLGLSRARGFAVYTPELELVGNQLYHAGELTASSQASVMRGDALRGYAVFADWADPTGGYWRLDVLNPEAPLVNMLMSEGAEQNADGLVTLNGVAIGSGSPGVAFRGKGENTQMFAFDEDVYGNAPVQYNIGENDYILEAPVWVSEVKGIFANTDINIVAREEGYWVTQLRADINDMNVPGVMYFNNDHELVWACANEEAFQEVNGTSSGWAVTYDNTIAAIGGYSDMKITVMGLEFVDGEPMLTKKYSFDQIPANGSGARWAQMVFDQANNLYVFDRRVGALAAYVLPGEVTANTPAKTTDVITKVDGLKGITVDSAAPVQYFNLQGIAVEEANMTPGIYVRRQGNVATKVVVR